ncbi:SPP1 phage holin family protein [Oceanobacillus sp. FSL H7-0719]|uniref:SPP1 phage holin family protein n=1 Tax=Oceanobacillus sp. FSL H7-0719 TaxID=2954507 RepID=UPI003248DD88
MKKINLKGVTKATWARIITLFLALANQVSISIFNYQLLPFDDAAIYEGVSTALTVVAAIIAGHKNNSVTVEAQKGDEVKRRLEGK